MKVLICGSREWKDAEKIAKRLRALPLGTIIVHGNCRGADRMAGKYAANIYLEVRAYSAEWGRFGSAAGVIRNKQMLDKEHPDLVIAFHENLVLSTGTKNMVHLARDRGIEVEVITEEV